MKIQAHSAVLSVFPSDTQAFFFDRSGRFFAAWDHGGYLRFGLSGRAVAGRWEGDRRRVRALKTAEIHRYDAGAKALLAAAYPAADPDLRPWLGRAMTYDRAEDVRRFKSLYHAVGILPPDQYNACVVQVTEGCRWNQCSFCSFYRGTSYRVKDAQAMASHVDDLLHFFGAGLSLRRSIFLGEANALGAPLRVLVQTMEELQRKLIPQMGPFRGFYAFSEGSGDSLRSLADFLILARLGLKRVYYGLETGEPALRKKFGKPGSLETIHESVENARTAGIHTALMILVGAGGRAGQKDHVENTLQFIRGLPLAPDDFIYLSPLYGNGGSAGKPLDTQELEGQMERLRRGLSRRARVAPYDIREFVY